MTNSERKTKTATAELHINKECFPLIQELNATITVSLTIKSVSFTMSQLIYLNKQILAISL